MGGDTLAFVLRVLRAFDAWDGADKDDLWWRTDGEYAPVTFLVNCNDFFCWGTADDESVTPANVGVLEQAIADCRAASPVTGRLWATHLFCCRVRGMRPLGACYAGIEKTLWPLFDACGPERPDGGGNPKPRPSE